MIDYFGLSNADRVSLKLPSEFLGIAPESLVSPIIRRAPMLNLSNIVLIGATLLFVVEVILNWQH